MWLTGFRSIIHREVVRAAADLSMGSICLSLSEWKVICSSVWFAWLHRFSLHLDTLLPNSFTFWSSYLMTTTAVQFAASKNPGNLADIREGQAAGASGLGLDRECPSSLGLSTSGRMQRGVWVLHGLHLCGSGVATRAQRMSGQQYLQLTSGKSSELTL